MKNQLLTDEMFADFEEFEKLINMLEPMVFDSSDGLPEDFRRTIARVIERARMFKSLERQFREQKAVQGKLIDILELQQENRSNVREFKGGWKEA